MSPFAGAAAAASPPTRLRTGTLVFNNDLRHPVDTAREAAAVGDLSGGRFELGIGAGHMKSEYDAAGLRFDSGATRVDRLIESVNVLRPLLAGEPVDVDGAHYCVRADAGALSLLPRRPSRYSSAATAPGCCSSPDASPTSSAWRASATTVTPPRYG